MAGRNKNASATVVVLDVGKGMDTHLEQALRAVSLLVETKVRFFFFPYFFGAVLSASALWNTCERREWTCVFFC